MQASRLAWILVKGVEYDFVDKIMFSSGSGYPNYSRSLSALFAHRHTNRGLMLDTVIWIWSEVRLSGVQLISNRNQRGVSL